MKQVLAPQIIEPGPNNKIEETKTAREFLPPLSPDTRAPAPGPTPEDAKIPSPAKVFEASPKMPDAELSLPELNETWSEGDFTLIMNRCHDCRFHEAFCRHSEEVLLVLLMKQSIL